MRDKTRTNGKAGRSRSNRESSNRTSGAGGGKAPGREKQQYNELQRETTQTGLRILARIIARAHLRRQASGGAPLPSESPQDMGTGD